MKKNTKNSKSLSQRHFQIAEEIRRSLAIILNRENIQNKLPQQKNITVTEVRMNNDLSHAIIFLSIFGEEMCTNTLLILKKIAPFIRSLLAKSLSLRYVPQIHLKPDSSFDRAEKIFNLLNASNFKTSIQ